MTQFNPAPYTIDKPTGQCALTGEPLSPGEAYIATLVEVQAPGDAAADGGSEPEASGADTSAAAASFGLRRVDVSLSAWNEGKRPEGIFGHWKTRVPEPGQKKKLFVDNAVLLDLLYRLADTTDPRRIAFRFIIALVLMRKKYLRYQGSHIEEVDGQEKEWWRMIPRGDRESVEILNPRLDDQQIHEMGDLLTEILASE